MSTEAQKRASKKYFLTHREYYREKTKESIKRIRQERKEYKQRIEDAIEYIKIQQTIFKDYDVVIENQLKNILNILEGKDGTVD